MKKTGLIIGILLVGVGLWWLLRPRSPKINEEELNTQTESKEEVEHFLPKKVQPVEPPRPTTDAVSVAPPAPTNDPQFEERKRKINERVQKALEKIEECRTKVDGVISEQELGEIESEMWSKLSNANSDGKRPRIEKARLDLINEKIVSLTAVPWHLDEITAVTGDIMADDIAAKDPKWVLETGGKLVPCGIYQAHRLFSLWTDMLGEKDKLTEYPAEFVEDFTISHVKRLLNSKLGSSGVSMQMEILINLAQKGYFEPELRQRLLQFDETLNQDLESFTISGEAGDTSLIQAIKRDYTHGENIRTELLDMLGQYYPD